MENEQQGGCRGEKEQHQWHGEQRGTAEERHGAGNKQHRSDKEGKDEKQEGLPGTRGKKGTSPSSYSQAAAAGLPAAPPSKPLHPPTSRWSRPTTYRTLARQPCPSSVTYLSIHDITEKEQADQQAHGSESATRSLALG